MNDDSEWRTTIEQHIREYGWHCLHVFPTEKDGDVQLFTYSIGFAERYGHPEIVVFGLSRDKAHALLAQCASVISAGSAFKPDVEDDRVLANDYMVVFRPVPQSGMREYLGTARGYYRDRTFEALVMFLPDRSGKFPWEPDYAGMDATEALGITGPPNASGGADAT